MLKSFLWAIVITAIFAILYFLFGRVCVSCESKSYMDISDAKKATKDVVCILISVQGISPHNNKSYQMGNCELNWLIENRGWKTVNRPDLLQTS